MGARTRARVPSRPVRCESSLHLARLVANHRPSRHPDSASSTAHRGLVANGLRPCPRPDRAPIAQRPSPRFAMTARADSLGPTAKARFRQVTGPIRGTVDPARWIAQTRATESSAAGSPGRAAPPRLLQLDCAAWPVGRAPGTATSHRRLTGSTQAPNRPIGTTVRSLRVTQRPTAGLAAWQAQDDACRVSGRRRRFAFARSTPAATSGERERVELKLLPSQQPAGQRPARVDRQRLGVERRIADAVWRTAPSEASGQVPSDWADAIRYWKAAVAAG